MRLDKLLSNLGYGSRKEVHNLIKKGSITINDEVVTKKDYAVQLDRDHVVFRGDPVDTRLRRYIAFHKPSGYITAISDREQATIMDLLPAYCLSLKMTPVGRLDKDTEGLIFITNDGQWAHHIINGRKDVTKIYYFTYEGTLLPNSTDLVAKGLTLEDGTVCKEAKLELFGTDEGYMEVREGKYHQVKRMISACGGTITYLKRVQIGPIHIDSVGDIGAFRELSESEIDEFYSK